MSECSADAATAFDCRMCGFCCLGAGGIVLRAHDRERLRVALGLSATDFQARYTEERNGKVRLSSGVDGACIFFRGGKGCGVHQDRPDICRAWPFFRGNLIDPYSLALAKEGCPGIRRDISFDLFSRAGAAYLRQEGLAVAVPDAQNPAALVFDLSQIRLKPAGHVEPDRSPPP